MVLEPPAYGDLWETARAAKEQLLSQEKPAGIATSLGFFDLSNGEASPAVANLAAQLLRFELLVTNLGKIPFESHYGDLSIEAIWGPILNLGFEGEQTVGVATSKGALRLVHTSYEPVKSLLERSITLLMEACQTPVYTWRN